MNELHRFVSIALHSTAGEGDYESDKLATLRTVVTAFEPLIYGLRGDVTYEEFCKKCRSVWDELRKNPRLPYMLVGMIQYSVFDYSAFQTWYSKTQLRLECTNARLYSWLTIIIILHANVLFRIVQF